LFHLRSCRDVTDDPLHTTEACVWVLRRLKVPRGNL
jgi:hypothetical protein